MDKSNIALAVSIVSATFVIIDRVKNWKKDSRIQKLKKEKAILKEVIELNASNFIEAQVESKGDFRRTTLKPKHAQLKHMLEGIDANEISNKRIVSQLEKVKQIKELFVPTKTKAIEPDLVFCDDLKLLQEECKHYLSEVL